MKNLKKMSYEAPMVEIVEVEVEQGFATSQVSDRNGILGWGNEGEYEDSFLK